MIGFSLVTAALVIGLWGKRADFTEAVGSASLLVLGGAVPVAMAHGAGRWEGAARWSARWRALRRSR